MVSIMASDTSSVVLWPGPYLNLLRRADVALATVRSDNKRFEVQFADMASLISAGKCDRELNSRPSPVWVLLPTVLVKSVAVLSSPSII